MRITTCLDVKAARGGLRKVRRHDRSGTSVERKGRLSHASKANGDKVLNPADVRGGKNLDWIGAIF
jgi:hypothetical protein